MINRVKKLALLFEQRDFCTKRIGVDWNLVLLLLYANLRTDLLVMERYFLEDIISLNAKTGNYRERQK